MVSFKEKGEIVRLDYHPIPRVGPLPCRRKALLALSCLTRHYDPAMDAFRNQGGLQLLLKTAADASDPRQQRCPYSVSPFSTFPAALVCCMRTGLSTQCYWSKTTVSIVLRGSS